ncbi:LacI family transcriptional regulator [bacterium]|nr:LacI family transcriptional regulator [bacterium]
MTALGKGPSIHDVAREANVSIATVSRVVNGPSRVAEKTRHRVEAAMRRLNYKPNIRARALSRKRSETLGLILPDLFGDYFGELMRGVDDRARQEGLHLMVTRAQGEREEHNAAEQFLQGGRVDGLVLMIPEIADRTLEMLSDLAAPIVILDKDVGHYHLDNILVDNKTGARDMTNHLLKAHARTDLIFLGGPELNIDTRDRADGFRDALRSAGIPPQDDQFVYTDYDYDAGYEVGRDLAKRVKSRDGHWGIVAANDDLAKGVIDAFARAGIEVPNDVAVVGYDDSRMARLTRPSLTTVRVPLREIGALAVEMLIERISGQRTRPFKTIMKAQLVPRESCGCPDPRDLNGNSRRKKRNET